MNDLKTVDVSCACGGEPKPAWHVGLAWWHWLIISILGAVVFVSCALGILDVELRIMFNSWW